MPKRKAVVAWLAAVAALAALLAQCPGAEAADAELLAVQVVARHGIRTPTLAQVKDFWFAANVSWTNCALNYPGVTLVAFNETTLQPWNATLTPIPRDGPASDPTQMPPAGGPCFQEWLTSAGYALAQQTGANLRRTYLGKGPGRVLPTEWSPDLLPRMWLHADNLQRTINTLRGLLGGLWPAAAAFPTNSTAAAAFPMMLDEEPDDYLALYCTSVAAGPYPQQVAAVNVATANTRAGNRTAAAVAKELKLAPNFTSVAPPFSWTNIYDVLEAEMGNGVPVPKTLKRSTYADVSRQDVANRAPAEAPTDATCLLGNNTACADIIRGTVGPLLYRLVCNMRRVGGATPPCATPFGLFPGTDPRLLLYAGHDTTLNVLRSVLGLKDDLWPVFCENLAFELWRERDGRLTVRVRQMVPPRMGSYVKIGGVGKALSLEQFETLVKRYNIDTAAKLAMCGGSA